MRRAAPGLRQVAPDSSRNTASSQTMGTMAQVVRPGGFGPRAGEASGDDDNAERSALYINSWLAQANFCNFPAQH